MSLVVLLRQAARDRPPGADLLAQGFGPGFNGPLQVVGSIHNAKDLATMEALDQKLRGKPDVAVAAPLQVSPKIP